MEQQEEIETNQYEREIEPGHMRNNERENTNTRPRRSNAGKWVEILEMNFGGKTYDTQFTTSTGEKKQFYIYDMHKLDVDVEFIQMTSKKGIKYGEREMSAMYKE